MKKNSVFSVERLTNVTGSITMKHSVSIFCSQERILLHAIGKQEITPHFQPIVDNKMRPVGFEILSRWRKKNTLLQPDEFLPFIRNENIWFLFTEFILQEAVFNINRYAGKFYFSVNIPPYISQSNNFYTLIKSAIGKLQEKSWVEKLILEISEKTDFFEKECIAENIKKMNELGVRIFLDDCFSKVSLIYPVRLPRFSGYKLDISIVNDSLSDFNSRASIECLAYYCKLTQCSCIAEGVDSTEKLNALKKMGVKYYQGYLISKPLDTVGLYNYIRKNA